MPASSLLDLATRLFWRATGRRVDLDGQHSWLGAPTSASPVVGDSWLEAFARPRGWRLDPRPDAGLLPSLSDLDGPSFLADHTPAAVRSFYESTARWQLDVWSQWSPIFQPFGAIIGGLFGRRVQQLALPIRPLDVAHGMDNRVVPLMDGQGSQRAAAWIRTIRATGETAFSGCYTVGTLPGHPQPLVHVSFPLESGNVQVYLTPVNHADGSVSLVSGAGRFGEPGTYVVVQMGGRHYARRIPIHEAFHLYVDADGVLRTDHELRLGRFTVLRLHYRLT
ncbi:hypothetical protein [Tessaracoccus massiliensis]|uniref:hypothetical protein n=1 Tax=Tessaracoccus massiliensis TaxID=1522311 RepID=UPI00058FA798|nr:hypothetical protein [Tessaracoccus massiliensis]